MASFVKKGYQFSSDDCPFNGDRFGVVEKTGERVAHVSRHRGPVGPNEDWGGLCPGCGARSWRRRPPGHTWGWHLMDCALEIDHLGECVPGGDGHGVPDIAGGDVVHGHWPGGAWGPEIDEAKRLRGQDFQDRRLYEELYGRRR